MKLLVLICTQLFCIIGVFSQVPPSLDKTWMLESNLSDEFNGPEINEDLWCVLGNHSECEYYNWGGNSYFRQSNSYIVDSVLILRADTPLGSFCCYTGGIQSIDPSFDFGYIEIFTKLPGYIDGNGFAHTRKLWPALWLYSTDYSTYHDELDIIDNYSTLDGLSINQQAVNESDPYIINNNDVFFQVSSSMPQPYCEDFHKLAAEWNHDRIIFYVDDVPVGSIYNHSGCEMVPMKVVLDFQIFINEYFEYIMPYYFEIDYFRYYRLRQSCSTDKVLLTSIAFNKYFNYPAVQQSIVIGNGLGIITDLAGTNRTLRAVGDVVIYGEFNVPLNTEFNIIPTPCY